MKSFLGAVRDRSLKFRDYVKKPAQTRDLDDRLFAVDMSNLKMLDADEARELFDRTELARVLKDLIFCVIRRISGQQALAAYLLDTKMGESKLHIWSNFYFVVRYRSISSIMYKAREMVNEMGVFRSEKMRLNGH